MKFGVSMELDFEAERNARAVQRFADALAAALDQDYGADLQNLTIGIICVRSRPGYEDCYKPRLSSLCFFESGLLVNLDTTIGAEGGNSTSFSANEATF